jgi:hypothetical protein
MISVINDGVGQTRANNSVLPKGVGGIVAVRCAQASGTVHLVVDISGYFQ